MCYGMRAEPAEPGREGASQPSSGLERLRPRLAGAAAAVLVAGFAVAALVTPAPTQVAVRAVPRAAPVAPTAPVVEQSSVGQDDGVPTALNETKRAGGDCHHGL